MLNQVYVSGETFSAYERPVHLLRNGQWDVVYQNFVYEPYKDENGLVQGIIAITIDVTQQVLARHRTEENENASAFYSMLCPSRYGPLHPMAHSAT
ncbi:hypothetical protein LWM68_27490 [Niabella sp. W65]|nr:hypothetical protein [Niabella sp. W65]MCH7366185.1 hypothetical protein [Niabella sp. W65]ULT41917.1 hypothetical protein KRR40_46440 [Niabella sp. I65]